MALLDSMAVIRLMRKVSVLAILLVFGLGKLHWEQRLTEDHRNAYFHGAKLNLGLRQQIGQFGFVAALSGFRSLVADLLWIRAHSAWEATQWGRMALLFNNVTALQPRAITFWDMAAWHMAWNASVAAREDRHQPREALRIKAQREYFELGKDFLVRGIQNNPDRWNLYFSLGNLYKEKYRDHLHAAEQFRLAAQFHDAPVYVHRFAVYELAKVPGKEREAYTQLVELYQKGINERVPTLTEQIQRLQISLNIPPEQRIKIENP